jgi:hypothetical protein
VAGFRFGLFVASRFRRSFIFLLLLLFFVTSHLLSLRVFGFVIVSSCRASASRTCEDDAEIVAAEAAPTQLPLELTRLHRTVLVTAQPVNESQPTKCAAIGIRSQARRRRRRRGLEGGYLSSLLGRQFPEDEEAQLGAGLGLGQLKPEGLEHLHEARVLHVPGSVEGGERGEREKKALKSGTHHHQCGRV